MDRMNPVVVAFFSAAAIFLADASAPGQDKAGGQDKAAPPKKSTISDTIVKTNGQRLRNCEVISDTIEKLTYKQGATEKTLPGAEVLRIEWSEPPEALTRGEFAEEKGEFEPAANFYAEAANSGARELVRIDAAFRSARCQVRAAASNPEKAAPAAAALQTFRDTHKDSRLVPMAMLLQGRALRYAGKFDESVAALKELEELATTKSLGQVWDAQAKYERALTLMDAGKFDDARFAFQGVSSAITAVRDGGTKLSRELQSMLLAAEVGQGEGLIAANKLAEATQFYDQLASKAGTDPILAVAAAGGRAEAAYFEGVAKKDVLALRSAQTLCARVIATDTLDGDSTAKALYYTGKILLALGPDLEKEDPAKRAAEYFSRVVKYFPASRWARKAQAEKP